MKWFFRRYIWALTHINWGPHGSSANKFVPGLSTTTQFLLSKLLEKVTAFSVTPVREVLKHDHRKVRHYVTPDVLYVSWENQSTTATEARTATHNVPVPKNDRFFSGDFLAYIMHYLRAFLKRESASVSGSIPLPVLGLHYYSLCQHM